MPSGAPGRCSGDNCNDVTEHLVPLASVSELAAPRTGLAQGRILGRNDRRLDAGAAGRCLRRACRDAPGDRHLCIPRAGSGGRAVQRLHAPGRGAHGTDQPSDRRIADGAGRTRQCAVGGHGGLDGDPVRTVAAGDGAGALWLVAQSGDLTGAQRLYPGSGAADSFVPARGTDRAALRSGRLVDDALAGPFRSDSSGLRPG